MAGTVANYDFDRVVGKSTVRMLPRGVLAAITALEQQFRLYRHQACACNRFRLVPRHQTGRTECISDGYSGEKAASGRPACRVFNIVNGTGPVVGAALTQDPDVATVSFTGSTQAAKIIQRAAIDGMKRVVLELEAKHPPSSCRMPTSTKAIPVALMSGFANSGQACVAGNPYPCSKVPSPRDCRRLRMAAEKFKVGDPRDPEVRVGPSRQPCPMGEDPDLHPAWCRRRSNPADRRNRTTSRD